MQTPVFGAGPSENTLKKIELSKNYKNGEFKNQVDIPVMTREDSIFYMLTHSFKNKGPIEDIPAIKTDLKNLDIKQDTLVWFGHSSYFMQIDGKTFLVDPVLDGNASPIPLTIKAFSGSNLYKSEDMPNIDYLIITHDHYDHLDYKTIKNLVGKIKRVIVPLGVGADFVRWGFDEGIINETDWGDTINLWEDNTITSETSQHFSGRKFKRNQTLWTSYLLSVKGYKIFIGGDGGYGPHFAKIGEKYGSIDLAILENGQNSKNWKYIHMSQEEVIRASKDLNARRLFAVHNSKFTLGMDLWSYPLNSMSNLSERNSISLMTPMIGEVVELNNSKQEFKKWWENVK